MDTSTTFIIADKQDITRAGLHHYLTRTAPAFPTVDVADKKELVSALVTSGGKAVVIIDYTLFDLSGVEELLVIGKRFPMTLWVLFSHELGEKLMRRLAAEGNISLLLKESADEEIIATLKCALRGERYLCHQVTNLLLTTPQKQDASGALTPTEVEILKLIAKGLTVKEIAAQRISSIHTIVTHKKNIFRKLEINNVHEATKYALRAGLVEMMEYYI